MTEQQIKSEISMCKQLISDMKRQYTEYTKNYSRHKKALEAKIARLKAYNPTEEVNTIFPNNLN